jgi:mannose-6-phosphate isomerase-like protein (cupin superfamily)
MKIALQDALSQLPASRGQRFIELLRRGSLSVELYAPQGHDPQQPHAQDELYVVVSGSGRFRHGDDLQSFAAGDVLFVPAGDQHRFEDFSDDFATWVIFVGPQGGQRP